MKNSMLILTLMVAALCGCAAQQPTNLETPESSELLEVTPETGRAYRNTDPLRSPDCETYPSSY